MMKVLPEKKPFVASLIIAIVLNISELFRVDGLPKLIAYFIDTLLLGIIVLILLRTVVWISKKIGLVK
jgi:hypothetical protein